MLQAGGYPPVLLDQAAQVLGEHDDLDPVGGEELRPDPSGAEVRVDRHQDPLVRPAPSGDLSVGLRLSTVHRSLRDVEHLRDVLHRMTDEGQRLGDPIAQAGVEAVPPGVVTGRRGSP